MNVAWVVLHCNRRIGARERRQLIPHVRFQVPFLGPESQVKSGFACVGLLVYSWLITARCDYLCCQHAGASMGREAVGAMSKYI